MRLVSTATSTELGRHRRTQLAVPASSATAKHGVRRDLQGLRAVAVLGVVVYHLRARWLPGGFAGVDVFFVLSGYFITGLLLREIDLTGRASSPSSGVGAHDGCFLPLSSSLSRPCCAPTR